MLRWSAWFAALPPVSLHLGGVNLPIAAKLAGLDQPALNVLEDSATIEVEQVSGLLSGQEGHMLPHPALKAGHTIVEGV